MELRMRIEEFLRKNGKKYELRVIDKEDRGVHIEVQTLAWDGDESTQEFFVCNNILFPIEIKKENEHI
jgi:hypothetical protein